MGVIISAFASWLMSFLALLVAWGARYFLARLIMSFGIGILTVTGVSAGISALESLIQNVFVGSSQSMLWITSFFGVMGFDSFVNIVFAALIAKLTLKGMQQGGNISRLFINGQE